MQNMMENELETVKEPHASDAEKLVSSEAPVERFHDALSGIISVNQDKSIDGDKAVPMDEDKLMTGHEAAHINEGKSVSGDKAAPADDKPMSDHVVAPAGKDILLSEHKPIAECKSVLVEEDKPMGEQAAAVDKCKPMGMEDEILLEHETSPIQTNAEENNTNVEMKSTEQIQQESAPTVALDDNKSIQKSDAEPSKDEKREASRIPDCESKLYPESEQLTNGKAEIKEVLDTDTSFKSETVLSGSAIPEAHKVVYDKSSVKATNPLVDGNGKNNEVPSFKSETPADEETTNTISHLESLEPPVDTKLEPSDVTGNKLGIANGTSRMECCEIVQSVANGRAQHSETTEEKKKFVQDAGFKSTEKNAPATLYVASSNIISELENNSNLKGKKDKTNTLFLDESPEGRSGTEEEQTAFMEELAHFFKLRNMEFKPPKFYGEGLNCLKLWRAVMKLGGYDKVTSCKLWRQVGETFKPPKTCTTVSWTFRGFYEKALLDFERSKIQGGELVLSTASNAEPMSVDNQAPGEGRARRDAAARAMQGWHSQRVLDNGEISNPIVKDKSSASLQKREKQVKNLDGSGLLRHKKPSDVENDVKTPRTKRAKLSLDVDVVDIGTPAEWVKINVEKLKDYYEIYALVPGLLREEIRVQSDPAGRVVISGEPANPDNSWGVTPFKKVVSLPSRIDPHQTSAVVTLHGQLYIKVPFESSA